MAVPVPDDGSRSSGALRSNRDRVRLWIVRHCAKLLRNLGSALPANRHPTCIGERFPVRQLAGDDPLDLEL